MKDTQGSLIKGHTITRHVTNLNWHGVNFENIKYIFLLT